MKPNPSDDEIEQWLRSETKVQLPDDGFTRAVLARLPAKSPEKSRAFSWQNLALGVAFAAVLGTVLPLLANDLLTFNQAWADDPAALGLDLAWTLGTLFMVASLVLISRALPQLRLAWDVTFFTFRQVGRAFGL